MAPVVAPHKGDRAIVQLIRVLEEGGALSRKGGEVVRQGAARCDIQWLSQLAGRKGMQVFPWEKVRGWEWVMTLMGAMPTVIQAVNGQGWHLLQRQRLKEWNNEGAEGRGGGHKGYGETE